MRTYAISTLFLVFALVSGACAGRQTRTRSIPAPPRAEVTASVLAPAPVAEAPVADMAPTIEPEPVAAPVEEVRETPAMAGSRMIAEHNASVRAAAEKLHRTHVSEPLPNNDEICAALTFDAASVAAGRARAAASFRAFWREMFAQIAKYEAEERAARKTLYAADRPRPKSRAAPAAKDDGREVVVGSLASASPAVTQADPAPAGPSILPAPPGVPTVITAGPATDRMPPSFFVPDPSAVEQSQAQRSRLLYVVLLAACIGILFGIYPSWRRKRRLRALSERPYSHYPDGTILMQEVVGGVVVTKEVFPPDPPAPPETDASDQEAQMDSFEQTWHAEGDAAQEEPPIARPLHDRFDHTDTDAEFDAFERTDPQPPPVPFPEPDTIVAPEPSTPHVQPESADAPRLAAGSGKIISSSDDVSSASGDVDTPLPPLEPRSEPESHAKVIIYEDDSSNATAPAATSTPN